MNDEKKKRSFVTDVIEMRRTTHGQVVVAITYLAESRTVPYPISIDLTV